MENPQVTIALQGAELTGELGRPMLAVFLTANGHEEEVVVLRQREGVLREVCRYEVPQVPLTVGIVDELTALVEHHLYWSLAGLLGVQVEFEAMP